MRRIWNNPSIKSMFRWFMAIALCHLMLPFYVWTADSESGSEVRSPASFYPAMTRYAIPLYGINAKQQQGRIKTLAAQLVLKGEAVLTWQTNLSAAGDYEVVLDYSTHQPSIQVEVISDESKVTDTLHRTKGVYTATG